MKAVYSVGGVGHSNGEKRDEVMSAFLGFSQKKNESLVTYKKRMELLVANMVAVGSQIQPDAASQTRRLFLDLILRSTVSLFVI